MKKEFIKIGIALLVLFAIAIPLSLYREKKMTEEELKEQEKKFIAFDVEKVDRFQITNHSGFVELQKRKKDASGKFDDEFNDRTPEFKVPPAWIVVAPYRAIADSMLVNSFFSQIQDLDYQKVIQEDQNRKADYNLDKPSLTVRFFDENQNESKLTVHMGSENPTKTGFYFISSIKPGIYLGGRLMQPYIEQEVVQWHERRVIEFPNLDGVTKVAFSHESKVDSFEVEKKDGNWKFTSLDRIIPPDQHTITDFVGHMSGMRAIKVFTDPSVINKSKKLATITLISQDRKDPVDIAVYNGGSDSEIYYLRRSDLAQIFSVAVDPKLVFSYQDVVDKRLFTEPLTNLTSVKIIKSGVVTEANKQDDIWMAKKPFQDEVSTKRLDSFLQVLRDYEPLKYVPNVVLSESSRKLYFEYTGNEGKKGFVGFYQEGSNFFAKAELNGLTKTVSINKISPELSEHLSHFRNDDLLPVFDDRLKYLSFSRDGMRIELEQDVKKLKFFVKTLENTSAALTLKWKAKELPEEFYSRVSEMYLVDFVSHPDPTEKFDTAELKITTVDSKEYHWNFGKKKGEMIDVYSPDRKVVGRIPWVKYKELAEFLDEPKKTGK